MKIKTTRKVEKVFIGGKWYGRVMFMLPELSELKEVEITITKKEPHGSAISNANVLADVVKGKADELSGTDIDGSNEGNETLTVGSSHEHPEPKNNPTRGNMTLHNKRELANKPHCSRSDNISNAKQHSSHEEPDHTSIEGKTRVAGADHPALQ